MQRLIDGGSLHPEAVAASVGANERLDPYEVVLFTITPQPISRIETRKPNSGTQIASSEYEDCGGATRSGAEA